MNVRKVSDKAVLIYHEKLTLEKGLVSERKVWKLSPSDRYPIGYKYRLVLANSKNHEVILLHDNHWPKGPHVHCGENERKYEFVSLEKVLLDFIQESELEERRYHENKENND